MSCHTGCVMFGDSVLSYRLYILYMSYRLYMLGDSVLSYRLCNVW